MPLRQGEILDSTLRNIYTRGRARRQQESKHKPGDSLATYKPGYTSTQQVQTTTQTRMTIDETNKELTCQMRDRLQH